MRPVLKFIRRRERQTEIVRLLIALGAASSRR
jgi:hypothetical protein